MPLRQGGRRRPSLPSSFIERPPQFRPAARSSWHDPRRVRERRADGAGDGGAGRGRARPRARRALRRPRRPRRRCSSSRDRSPRRCSWPRGRAGGPATSWGASTRRSSTCGGPSDVAVGRGDTCRRGADRRQPGPHRVRRGRRRRGPRQPRLGRDPPRGRRGGPPAPPAGRSSRCTPASCSTAGPASTRRWCCSRRRATAPPCCAASPAAAWPAPTWVTSTPRPTTSPGPSTLADELGQRLHRGRGARHNLGYVRARAGDARGALERYARAEELYASVGSPERVLAALEQDRAEVLLDAGLLPEAVAGGPRRGAPATSPTVPRPRRTTRSSCWSRPCWPPASSTTRRLRRRTSPPASMPRVARPSRREPGPSPPAPPWPATRAPSRALADAATAHAALVGVGVAHRGRAAGGGRVRRPRRPPPRRPRWIEALRPIAASRSARPGHGAAPGLAGRGARARRRRRPARRHAGGAQRPARRRRAPPGPRRRRGAGRRGPPLQRAGGDRVATGARGRAPGRGPGVERAGSGPLAAGFTAGAGRCRAGHARRRAAPGPCRAGGRGGLGRGPAPGDGAGADHPRPRPPPRRRRLRSPGRPSAPRPSGAGSATPPWCPTSRWTGRLLALVATSRRVRALELGAAGAPCATPSTGFGWRCPAWSVAGHRQV